jgi:hypothetical protein
LSIGVVILYFSTFALSVWVAILCYSAVVLSIGLWLYVFLPLFCSMLFDCCFVYRMLSYLTCTFWKINRNDKRERLIVWKIHNIFTTPIDKTTLLLFCLSDCDCMFFYLCFVLCYSIVVLSIGLWLYVFLPLFCSMLFDCCFVYRIVIVGF